MPFQQFTLLILNLLSSILLDMLVSHGNLWHVASGCKYTAQSRTDDQTAWKSEQWLNKWVEQKQPTEHLCKIERVGTEDRLQMVAPDKFEQKCGSLPDETEPSMLNLVCPFAELKSFAFSALETRTSGGNFKGEELLLHSWGGLGN